MAIQRQQASSSSASSGSTCSSCFAGIRVFLETGDRWDDNGQKSTPKTPPMPHAEVMVTELPSGWGRTGPSSCMDLARLREDEDSPDDQYAKPAKQGGMKIVTSMPAFLDHMAEEDANGGTSAAFRHQASVQEQSVDLRPLMLNGMSSGMQACDESAVVVFANVPSKGAFLEFVLQGTCDLMDPCWSMPFRQTKLPQGMYTFHFLVGGTRMLSSSYPVMGDKNVAIFSDSFRRYIVGHGSGTTASEVLESSPDGSPRQRLNSFNLATPPKETGMKRRVASYSQGLNSQAENMQDVAGSQVASLTKILQDKRTPTALFFREGFCWAVRQRAAPAASSLVAAES